MSEFPQQRRNAEPLSQSLPCDDRAMFEQILNFRDVAVSINDPGNAPRLRSGLLYRSARPDLASASDREKLVEHLKISTIIDLRSKTEHIEATQKYRETRRSTGDAALPLSDDHIADAIKIPGIDYAEINLNGKGFERHLIWQLSWWNLASLAGHMMLGYRLQGISIIGKNVLQPRGLIGLGQDTLEHSGPEVKEVFDVLSNDTSFPVLIHCTQGKDRTGLIVILVLLLCGVHRSAITSDYVRSEAELEPELEERMKEISSIGLDESFARCPSNFVQEISTFLDVRYGSIGKYLNHIGVDEGQIKLIRAKLID